MGARFRLSLLGVLILAALAILVIAAPARAQYNASIQGTVVDTSGAVVAGANVAIKNDATGVTQSTTSTTTGFYAISGLPPGSYDVTVSATNFQTNQISGVVVRAEQVRGLDITLQLGQVTQKVTVNGAVQPASQTEDANIAGTLSSQVVQALPKFDRDPYELVRLSPGVFGDGARLANAKSAGFPNGPGNNNGSGGTGGSNVAIFQTENQQPISASGQRVTANSYLVDGVSVNSLVWGGAALVTPSPDSVQEITVISNDYDASDGRNSGAHIKVVTKSGTNTFHGGGFFQYENPGFNAYNRYNGFDPTTSLRTTARNNDAFRQFGGNLGGPIIHNKLFFFFNYEGLRDHSASVSNQWVETPELRQTLIAGRPNTPVAATLSAPGVAPRIVTLLPTDCTLWIAASQPCAVVPGGIDIGSPGGTYGTYLPSSNQNAGGGLDGVPDLDFADLLLPGHNLGNQYNARVDYVRGNNAFSASTFLTYLNVLTSDSDAQGRPMADILDKRSSPSGFLSWVSTISPTMLNQLRFNFTRFAYNEFTSDPSVNWGIPRTEIQGLPLPGGQRLKFGAGQGDTTPGDFGQNTFAWRDMVSLVHGNHATRIGFEGDRLQDNSLESGGSRPDYVFQQPWDFANGAPIFEQIAVNPSTGGPETTKPTYFRSTDLSFFIQDDWKFRPNFTINLGLRWDYFGPPTEAKGHLENIIPGSDPALGLVEARAVLPKQMWNTTWRNFGPRLGFAWSPSALQSKAVVRGGFGIAFNRFDDVTFENTRNNPPLAANYGICCGTPSSPFVNGEISYTLGASNSPFSYPPNLALITPINPATNLPSSFPPGFSAPDVYANPQNMPIPYVYLYSLQVQYALPARWIATLGYVGSSSHDLLRIKNLIYFYSTPSGTQAPVNNVYDFTPDTTADYNSLNFRLQHQFSRGLLLNFAYTYSKSIDDVSAEGPGSTTNETYPIDLATERGPSDYDATHYVTAYAVWDLPVFRNQNTWVGKLAGGWELSPIFTFHSGFPWTPVATNLCPVLGAGSLCPIRPIQYLGGALTGRHGTDAFLPPASGVFPNPSASYFTLQTSGSTPDFPGIGRNSFRGPRFSDIDLSLAKSFGLPAARFIGEGAKIELRMNVFNLFNKLNLAPFTFGSNSTKISVAQNCSGTPQVCTPIPNPNFGLADFSNGGLSGRTIELQGRFTF